MLDLQDLIQCVVCGAAMEGAASCGACGVRFEDDGGTPVLMRPDRTTTVTFQFRHTRATASDAFHRVFSYPAEYGPNADDVYHLDTAHRNVLQQLPAQARILEIGCGGGQMRRYLTEKYRYVGVDISKTRVQEHLRVHGGPDLLCDAHTLPFRAGQFDAVYSSAVTEHLACPILVAQEVHRVLKPGGWFLGNVSFLEPWHDASFFHMSPLGVYELLASASFDPVHIWPGKNYHAFGAVLRMGNRATGKLGIAGDAVNVLYQATEKLRSRLRRDQAPRIHSDAKVAAAIDWIARKA